MALEKMCNQLQEQMKNLEKQLYNENRRYRSSYDNEREIMSRLESNFRLYEDNVKNLMECRFNIGFDKMNALNAELSNKLAILESRLQKEERSKQDLREKVI